jgi:predicted acyltransferase
MGVLRVNVGARHPPDGAVGPRSGSIDAVCPLPSPAGRRSLEHRAWVGCSPWGLIQPSFMFMVGVSLPYAIASRVARGQGELQMFAHTIVHIATDYMVRAFTIHLGRAPFEVFGPAFAPILLGAATLTVFWLVLYWMYQRKVFLRI